MVLDRYLSGYEIDMSRDIDLNTPILKPTSHSRVARPRRQRVRRKGQANRLLRALVQ